MAASLGFKSLSTEIRAFNAPGADWILIFLVNPYSRYRVDIQEMWVD